MEGLIAGRLRGGFGGELQNYNRIISFGCCYCDAWLKELWDVILWQNCGNKVVVLVVFRCQDGMMIEGTGLQKAWRDGGQSRKRSMDMVRQRWEIQREKKEARKQQQMERDLKLIAKGDDWS